MRGRVAALAAARRSAPVWQPPSRRSGTATSRPPAASLRAGERRNASSGQFHTEVGSVAPLADGALAARAARRPLAFRPGQRRAPTPRGRAVRHRRRSASTTASATRPGASGSARWTSRAGPTEAALYCFEGGQLEERQAGITISNGLAWSPDGAHDVLDRHRRAHRLGVRVRPGDRRDERSPRLRSLRAEAGEPDLEGYGGRPDGAAVDAEGCYWVAMFEGERVLRFSPAGETAARGACAGALPDDAVLRRRRPARPSTSPSREHRPSGRGARSPAALRLRVRLRRRRARLAARNSRRPSRAESGHSGRAGKRRVSPIAITLKAASARRASRQPRRGRAAARRATRRSAGRCPSGRRSNAAATTSRWICTASAGSTCCALHEPAGLVGADRNQREVEAPARAMPLGEARDGCR